RAANTRRRKGRALCALPQTDAHWTRTQAQYKINKNISEDLTMTFLMVEKKILYRHIKMIKNTKNVK
ncbi:MAG: hypothetical protein AAF316_10845, partial [Cyanobacteria bacterium P01_A01_bin.80]